MRSRGLIRWRLGRFSSPRQYAPATDSSLNWPIFPVDGTGASVDSTLMPVGDDPDASGEVQRVAAAVTSVADQYVAEYLTRFPDRAELDGLSVERHDRLSDNSLAAVDEWNTLLDGWAQVIEPLDAGMLRGHPAWITYGILKEALESARRVRVCRYELWPVNHLNGWQADLAHLVAAQPVGDDAARAEAITRWSGLPRYIETEIENLREGLRLGFSTPRRPVQLVIEQLDALLESPIEEWPFYAPAERDGSAEFQAAWKALLEKRIAPAVERYRTYLRDEYAARAREAIAITAHPDGEAAYRAAFRAHTTIERPAAETFELGLRRVQQNLAEALEIGRTRLDTGDLRSLVARITDDPANRFQSRESMLAYAEDAVARSRERVDAFFSRRPWGDVSIEPYPSHLERDAVDDSYWPAAEDGSRQAQYLIALYHFAGTTRSNAEITAFHEAWPGHHLQVGVARERTATAHPITRLVSNAGFDEGWARYAEALAEEMGLYTSDYALASRRLWPARGMVVDPGIHVRGWSRERAAAFMAESGRMTPREADATVNRIAVWPGQFTAYDTGGLEFFALREQAERALGTGFDIREFHDVVLGSGAVTLPMLREQVQRWLGHEVR